MVARGLTLSFKTSKYIKQFQEEMVPRGLTSFHFIGPRGRFSHRVAMSVCMSVCLSVTIQNAHFRMSWRLLVEGLIASIGLQWHNFLFLFLFQWFFCCVFQLVLVFWASLLWIMGELAGGGSLAVAVGVSDSWRATCYYPHLSRDSLSPVCTIFLLSGNIFFLGDGCQGASRWHKHKQTGR